MIWIVFSFLAALMATVRVVIEKSLPRTIPATVVLWFTALFSLPMYAYFAWRDGFVVSNMWFWPLVIVGSLVGVLAQAMFLVAVQKFEISKVVPLMTLSPLMLLILETIIFGTLPSLGAVAGIGVLLAGTLYFHWDDESEHTPWDVLRNMWVERETQVMLGVVFLMALLGIADKLGSQWSSSGTWLLWAYAWYVVWISGYIIHRKYSFRTVLQAPKRLAVITLIQGAVALSILAAIQYTFVANVMAIKRLSVLLTVLYGAMVYKEELARHRFWAAMVMLFGVGLIVYYG